MPESERLTAWVRTAIGYSIWFILLLVLWRVVLSLQAVQESGFAVWPFQTKVFPLGLPWILIIDVAFLTIIIFSVLSLGGRLKEGLSLAFPRLPRLGNAAYLVGVLIAVIIGYFAYDDLILPPLFFQGVDWAYRLVFWVLVGGISVAILFELAQTLLAIRREAVSAITVPGTPPKQTEPSVKNCKDCGASVDPDDNYCRQCGARIE